MRKNTEIREMLYITIDSMRSEQASYNLWFKELEEVRNRSRKRLYSIADYAWDKRNVILYYTKWDREDIYFSKESLKRIRRFEKKHNLRAFEEVIENEKRMERSRRSRELDMIHLSNFRQGQGL